MEHDGCVGCKYENEDANSKHCLGCKQNAIDKYAPMTNGDKIRNMTDEELAEFLINFKNTFGEEYEGQQSCLDWLQSEVKGSE